MQANFENHYSSLVVLTWVPWAKNPIANATTRAIKSTILYTVESDFKTLQVVLLWQKDGKPLIYSLAF